MITLLAAAIVASSIAAGVVLSCVIMGRQDTDLPKEELRTRIPTGRLISQNPQLLK